MDELTQEELLNVSLLAEKQSKLEKTIEQLEETLKAKKQELNDVRDRDLPNALAEVGLSSITLKTGEKITVKQEIYASIPADNAQAAFAWLRQRDFGAIIKNVISTEFGKGEDERAIEAAMLLAEAGFTPHQKESVHPSTLKAFLKEQVNQGAEVPLDLFGAFVVNRAKVERK